MSILGKIEDAGSRKQDPAQERGKGASQSDGGERPQAGSLQAEGPAGNLSVGSGLQGYRKVFRKSWVEFPMPLNTLAGELDYQKSLVLK